jgi:hypothetical protein
MKRLLFLAWQDPVGRTWYPIGRLLSDNGHYTFLYTAGVREALKTGRFESILPFPDIYSIYESNDLFPLFQNRLLPKSRPEYKSALEWLSISETEDDPVAILARSGGQKATDTFEVFPCPEPTAQGSYETHFLLHGLSHMPPNAADRALSLVPGESLLVMRDFQNPKDELALALRTSEQYPGDVHIIGYCPRYLRNDILTLMANGVGENSPRVTVVRVNPPPAPIQYRVLCRVEMGWREGFEPFSAAEFQPIIGKALDMRNLQKVG